MSASCVFCGILVLSASGWFPGEGRRSGLCTIEKTPVKSIGALQCEGVRSRGQEKIPAGQEEARCLTAAGETVARGAALAASTAPGPGPGPVAFAGQAVSRPERDFVA